MAQLELGCTSGQVSLQGRPFPSIRLSSEESGGEWMEGRGQGIPWGWKKGGKEVALGDWGGTWNPGVGSGSLEFSSR